MTLARQDLQLLSRIREQLVAPRTALIKQLRALAREYGVNFPKSRPALCEALLQLSVQIRNASEKIKQLLPGWMSCPAIQYWRARSAGLIATIMSRVAESKRWSHGAARTKAIVALAKGYV